MDLEVISNGGFGSPLANQMLPTSSMFWKSRLSHISFVLSEEDVSYVPRKPQSMTAAECRDLQTPLPPTPGAGSIAYSMCHVGKKTHVDPVFPGAFQSPKRTLILQVWIPAAGSWVRRDQAGVSTPANYLSL